MAHGLFSSHSKTLRKDLREGADAVEDQIAELRAEIAALAGTLSKDAGKVRKRAANAASDIKERASDDIADLIAAGEDILASLQERTRLSGKQMRKNVHEHPLAALGIAAAAGFVIAALMRR